MSASYELTQEEEIDLAKQILPVRQYDCWYAHDIEGKTQYAISKEFEINLRTVRREIQRARLKMTESIAELQACRADGKLRCGITIEKGGLPDFAQDTTLAQVVSHLQFVNLLASA